MGDHAHVGVQLLDPLLRGGHLRQVEALGAVQDLTLEVRQLDAIRVDHAQRADARRGQVERRGRAQPPAPTTTTRDCRRRSCPAPPPAGSSAGCSGGGQPR